MRISGGNYKGVRANGNRLSFKKYNFNVLIDGKAVGYFSEVSAPEMADEPIEYRAGDHQAGTPVKMPGLKSMVTQH